MNNKVALITGGAMRVGEALVRHFHKNNYDIIFTYLNSKKSAISLRDELNRIRPKSALIHQINLASTKKIPSLIKAVNRFRQRLDVIIHNASSFFPTPLIGTTQKQLQEQWDDLVTVNCLAPLFISQQLIPLLKKSQGSILNIIDIHANQPMRRHTIYSISKAALQSQTKSLALELAPEIRVNGIAPGTILWPTSNKDPATQPKTVLKKIPLNRIGTTSEIAELALYLSTSTYLTGQIISFDGGRQLVI